MISVFNSNYSAFVTHHEKAILDFCVLPKKRKYVKTKFDAIVAKHFKTIIPDFASLLSAPPETLFQLKIHFDRKKRKSKDEIIQGLNLIGLYDLFIDKDCPLKFNLTQYSSSVLAEAIDVKTCPYCNENTSYTFYYKQDNRYRRTFDWDHIIPKDKYPFLAMSFFNLIPACKVCNQLKLNKAINVSPHTDFNPDTIYSYYVKGTHVDFITDPKSLKLMLRLKNNLNGKAVLDAMEVTGTDARIATQLDLVQDILNKKRMYESTYGADLEKFVNKKTGGRLNAKSVFFSIYFNHKDYYKRPFSKLTSDLIKNKRN